jgi:hypothetical protein
MNYDLEYFEKMLRLNSKTAEEICRIRWNWIEEVQPKTVLDYGSGVGFFRAYRPNGIEVYTYDIGQYPQTGMAMRVYDVICFWDVLEHIDDFMELEAPIALSNHVALSLPIVDGERLSESKHFKPGEHLHYWTDSGLKALFRKYGFELLKKGQPECPPREEIYSYLFKRRKWENVRIKTVRDQEEAGRGVQ